MKLKKREAALRDVKKLLHRFQTEISFSSRTVEELVRLNPGYDLCRLAMRKPAFRSDPCAALKETIPEIIENKKDRKLLEGFLDGLGASDTEGQMNHIRLYQDLIEENLREAHLDYENKSKLYTALGTFSGILLCIILI